MGGHRRARSVALLLTTFALGCLEAPPKAGNGTGDGDGGTAGADGGGVVETDGGLCEVIVSNRFDSLAWASVAQPAAFVDRAAGWTRVRSTPSTDTYAYGDIHTVAAEPLEGSLLTVEVDGPITSVIGEVGISWQNVGADDSYQLEVADGQLRARRTSGSADETDACISSCPEYSAIEHARLRLREDQGTVRYQVASEAGEWIDVGSAPATELAYQVVFYAGATGPGSGDLTVLGAEWLACDD